MTSPVDEANNSTPPAGESGEAGTPRPGVLGQARDSGIALAENLRREAQRTLERSRRSLDIVSGRHEPEVGLTPKDTIYARGTLRLYRYRPQAGELYRVPLVFVMSLVSKPYILDLVPGQSFVEYLLRQGFDVYMVDWGVPRPEDHTLRLEDYVLDMMPRCVEEVQRVSKVEDYSFLGYCMGGIFGLMYGMAFPRSSLKNLVTVATPIDFEGMGLLRRWADPRWFDVDRVVDSFGNIPAETIMASLEMLRPLERLLGYVRLWDNLWDPDYVYNWRVRYKWVQDQIPFPGECFRQMIKELMWGNKLAKGELVLGGRRLDPRALTCSVLNTMAEFDHMVPHAATQPITSLIGSGDKQDLLVRGGHVSLIAGRNAVMRLWPTVNDWLSVRSV